MFDDGITGSIDELAVDSKEKKKFINTCKNLIAQLESIKGKACTARMKIEDNLYEQYELIKRRKKDDDSTEKRAFKKIDAINVQSSLRERLKEKYTNGEINTTHIQDLLKTGLDEELEGLESDAQEVIIKKIENNRNNIVRHNSEEIAAFIVQTDNASRKGLDTWYQGILGALKRVKSLSKPSDESLKNLYLEQKEGLVSEIEQTTAALNSLVYRLRKLP